MKWVKLLKTTPASIKKKGCNATAQLVDDVLCINLWDKTAVTHRYFINTRTYEHGYVTMATMERSTGKLSTMVTGENRWYSYGDTREKVKLDELDKEKIRDALKADKYDYTVIDLVLRREEEYDRKKYLKAQDSKCRRIKELQEKVPPRPNMTEWIHGVLGAADYAMYHKESGQYRCTACDGKYTEKEILEENPELSKVRDKYKITCPSCGKKLTVKRRDGQRIIVKTKCMALQNIDDSMSVARHFDVEIWWDYKAGRRVFVEEAVRLFMYRNHPKYIYQIYYDAWGGFGPSNPENKRMGECYLYPDAGMIESALAGTYYEDWARMFKLLAADGVFMDYNRLMCAPKVAGVAEYLYKGGFKRLLDETVGYISIWQQCYIGCLNCSGKSIEEVFGIRDRQKINRLRQKDGGEVMLYWLQWADLEKKKVSEECLDWLDDLGIAPETLLTGFLDKVKGKMSVEQVMNYVKKQQLVSYPGKSASEVVNQWSDYLSMCEKENKKLDDEMVYKPRELKRRHDEIVEEINKRRILEDMRRNTEEQQKKAEEMNAKYPGAEEVLEEMKPKLEYASEEYTIIVPERLVDIMMEGQALHHCAGSSDRYFDRIRSRETYICFLRRTAEPEIPYYTIEVEPSGTIRQHRGYLDEEPNIEAIKPFLKEWQKHIKTTMSKADKELAKKSKQLREQNIEELTKARNTRVLQGLMEDFMDADDIGETGLMAAV